MTTRVRAVGLGGCTREGRQPTKGASLSGPELVPHGMGAMHFCWSDCPFCHVAFIVVCADLRTLVMHYAWGEAKC